MQKVQPSGSKEVIMQDVATIVTAPPVRQEVEPEQPATLGISVGDHSKVRDKFGG